MKRYMLTIVLLAACAAEPTDLQVHTQKSDWLCCEEYPCTAHLRGACPDGSDPVDIECTWVGDLEDVEVDGEECSGELVAGATRITAQVWCALPEN